MSSTQAPTLIPTAGALLTSTAGTTAPAAARGRRPQATDDRGSISVELALSVPLVVLLLFLVIGAINVSRSNLDVHAAATAAARAGSIARNPSAATAAARDAATVNLAGHCTAVTITADTSQFHRGGQFTVTIGCTVSTQRLTGVGLPGQLTVTATSTSPLDRYRSDAAAARNPQTPQTLQTPAGPNPRAGAPW
ncbi:TadE/TadG family type IV pilus assembly protein [Dactylosporangium sp. NPDC051485]|uniref:TadE/TadG family type IV pilus assembly protein n=1 Tax=Dactylosporangium sp. NPDC051485 TaxID=3154846 RepID=UPI003416DFAD